MKEKLYQTLSAALGAAVSFLTGIPPAVWVLTAVMSLDFLTGLMSGAMGVSDKTAHGRLAGGEAFRGLMKKGLILAVVLLAALLDAAVAAGTGAGFAAVTGATCLWFIAGEGISVLENAVRMGVRVPAVLTRALELMKEQGGNEKNTQNTQNAENTQKTQKTQNTENTENVKNTENAGKDGISPNNG